MEFSTVSIIFSILATVIAMLAFFRSDKDNRRTEDYTTRPLQLQAYERLVLLCERIAMPTLISRLSQPNLSAREMQVFLIETIKQEYEYNASQQIYVTEKAWEAVRGLRDQNMLFINTIANTLPPEASAKELNRAIMEAMMKEEKAAFHTYVAMTLNAEAKKLM
ncbi:MAG: hypothetical protein H0U44_06360 [Flavisolibacter sp.]|jgi:hypothetical protein|nr:hypothetical protein [Flavisolibacter sp.]